jgi:putative SOS response-associated peptidase YedK
MCGRFSLGVDTDRLVAEFGLATIAGEHRPRFNIAPSQDVLAVVRGPDGLRAGLLRWGLIPHWSKDSSMGARTINARSETVDRRPAFEDSFRRRRCWVLADGFYEWRKEPDGSRTPFHFHLPDGRPFAFAGLWDRWRGLDGAEILSCTLLTTEPNEAVRPIHDRMPVVLPPDARGRWLDPDIDPDELRSLLRPFPDLMIQHAVSDRVNSPAHDDPECVRPR